MRLVHQMAGLGFLSDLQHDIANRESRADWRAGHAIDIKIGAARDPGQFSACFGTRLFPAIAEQNGDLPVGVLPAHIAFDAIGHCYRGHRHFLQRRQLFPGFSYANETSHEKLHFLYVILYRNYGRVWWRLPCRISGFFLSSAAA